MGVADKLSVDDLGGMVRGTRATLGLLGTVFPGLSVEDLFAKLAEIEQSPVAQELLHQVVVLRKLKVG